MVRSAVKISSFVGECHQALGMESGEIPDSAITASSSFEDGSVGPKSARIRTEVSGGAWCPKPMIDRDSYEYLQIDLDKLNVIAKVEIQGRFGNGQGQEYTEEFLLEYQREDDGEWIRFRDRQGQEHFKGNENQYIPEVRNVSPPIIAKRIRFIPYSKIKRTVCMRVELYGCKWSDGVISYSMPQGDRRGRRDAEDLAFLDFTYDGIIKDNYLSGGIGQLMDGEEGQTNFRMDLQGRGIKGYEWIGWKTDSLDEEKPVEILFKFDKVRNFTVLNIHSNNFNSKDVRVFSKALVYFSVGGIFYKQSVKYDFQRDIFMDYARTVHIPLMNNVGQYMKVELYFDARWIMVSEVQIISEPATGNFSFESAPLTPMVPTTPKSVIDIDIKKPIVDHGKKVVIGIDSRDYAVPDVTQSALVVALPPQPQPPFRNTPTPKQGTPIIMTNSLSDKPPTYDALYAAADVINVQVPNIPSLQGVSGNNVYAVPNAELLLTLEHTVHLCEAVNVDDFINDDYFMNRNSSRPVLVAVKMLRRNADDRARADFHKEIKIMSQLKDPNIVRVLGVCTREEPLCMIVEYMKYGDLNQFLIDHVPESPVAQATNAKTLSYGCLVYMASQIASGMKYLESLNMVHRDLATRNCLVGTNYTIKISDFGMSRSLYSADYYRIEGRAVLPIRWMAWESILLGKFTTKSDVWSFAVTLWEVLTFAKDQPYDSLTDEQVIENAGHYYRNDSKEVYLPQPPNCPKELYDLMFECWNRNEAYRPTFREIHMFLQRKNMGYNPKDEKMNQIKVPIC
ncbi:hypothetical protein FSP39_016545 [Pinctada imbricata]|uniref:Discoidin domain-containing receptor 2 n=1 Tax=Pinctada imbricata TaxID=66713 RepID=A0AA89BNR1_PINIB|nr:hypothetical protein FSP39_016545 [Pinctada imbricata]